MVVAKIVEDLKDTDWFARVGQPTRLDVFRLHSWDEWLGPNDPFTEAIHLRQQAIHDDPVATAANPAELELAFDQLVAAIVELVRHRVPFDEEEDSWHAPSTAVWHAAWTAALVASHSFAAMPLPAEISAQWSWFCAGHWPASLAPNGDPSSESGYVVF